MMRLRQILNATAIVILTIAVALIMQSCFTGIEHTGHIDLSRRDREISRRISQEESFMADIEGETLDKWNKGRKFRIVGDRASLVFDKLPEPLNCNEIYYDSIAEVVSAGGTKKIYIYFSDCLGHSLRYNTTKSSVSEVISTNMPMLIDLSLVEQLQEKLHGRTLWTKTASWVSAQGEPIKGRKFAKVKVLRVDGGVENLPYMVIFKDDKGQEGALRMSQTEGTLSTRPFHTLFYLEDPRKNFAGISEEVWNLICESKLMTGMTKEECRLSIGNPNDVQTIADYSKLIDIWTYSNGAYLRFEDGLLVNFR